MKFVIFYHISRDKWWSDWIVSDVFLYYCLGKGYLIFYEAYTHPSLSAIILCNSPFTRFGKLVERGAAVMLSFRSFLYVGYSNSFEKSFIIMFPSQHLWYLPLFVFSTCCWCHSDQEKFIDGEGMWVDCLESSGT